MNTEAQGRKRAESFRREHDLGHAPLGDLVELLIDTCGVDVVVMDADGAEHALTMRDPMYDRTVIAVATQEHSVRQRTSIAHELAHVLWHDEDLGPETSFGGRTPIESRADSFARHLLLPLAAVKPVADAARTPDAAVAVLVERFDVSPLVAAIQLKEAGLLTADDCARWAGVSTRAVAARSGWLDLYEQRCAEARRPRAPRRLVARATSAYQAGVLGIHELASWAGLPSEKLAAVLAAEGISPREDEAETIEDDPLPLRS